jgi:hypothetical protein
MNLLAILFLLGCLAAVCRFCRGTRLELADNSSPDGLYRCVITCRQKGFSNPEAVAILYSRKLNMRWNAFLTNALPGHDSASYGNACVEWKYDSFIHTTGIVVYADTTLPPCKGTIVLSKSIYGPDK